MQRKSETIDLLEKAVTRLSAELETTQELLKDARDDLIRSQQQNESLSRQLQQMKQGVRRRLRRCVLYCNHKGRRPP